MIIYNLDLCTCNDKSGEYLLSLINDFKNKLFVIYKLGDQYKSNLLSVTKCVNVLMFQRTQKPVKNFPRMFFSWSVQSSVKLAFWSCLF